MCDCLSAISMTHSVEYMDVDDDASQLKYIGVFSESHSTDFIIKVCVTLFSFVLLLVVASYHVTRRSYRLPATLSLERLFASSTQSQGSASCQPLVRCPLARDRWLFVVNEPQLAATLLRHPSASARCPWANAPDELPAELPSFLTSGGGTEAHRLRCLLRLSMDGLLASGTPEMLARTTVARLGGRSNELQFVDVQKLMFHYLLELLVDCEPLSGDVVDRLEDMIGRVQRLCSLDGLEHISSSDACSQCDELMAEARLLLLPLLEEALDSFELWHPPTCLLDHFMMEKYGFETGGCAQELDFLTRGHLVGVALDVLLGGQPLAATLWHGLCRLAKQPELVDELGPRDDSCFNAFALELMRMHSIGADRLFRYVTEDLRLAEWDVPRGSYVRVNCAMLNCASNLWNSPSEFVWQRFHQPQQQDVAASLDTLGQANDSKGTALESTEEDNTKPLLPFSIGSRKCPAQDLSLGILVTLFQEFAAKCDFSLSLGKDEEVDQTQTLLLMPREN